MSKIGTYSSIAQAWLMHPNGGQPGDCIEVGIAGAYTTVYWDEITNSWGDPSDYPNQTPHDTQIQDLYAKVDALKKATIHIRGYYDTVELANTLVTYKKTGDIAYIKDVLSTTGYYTATLVNGVFVKGTLEAPSPEVDFSQYVKITDILLWANNSYDADMISAKTGTKYTVYNGQLIEL